VVFPGALGRADLLLSLQQQQQQQHEQCQYLLPEHWGCNFIVSSRLFPRAAAAAAMPAAARKIHLVPFSSQIKPALTKLKRYLRTNQWRRAPALDKGQHYAAKE
jgi:hypothetical protein